METWKLIGVDRDAHVVIRSENKTIKGVKWFLVGESGDVTGRFLGEVCREQFISNERLQRLNVAPMPGQTVTMYFNRFGDIEKVEVA